MRSWNHRKECRSCFCKATVKSLYVPTTNQGEKTMAARRLSALLLGLFFTVAACADEGMWTFHDFPQALLKQQHGIEISSAWLDRVRTATVRLSGCTASFVSPEGLILTNHHCAAACLDEHSSGQQNLIKDGFLARTRETELRCATQVADVLMAIENVTDKRGRNAQSQRPGGERRPQEDPY